VLARRAAARRPRGGGHRGRSRTDPDPHFGPPKAQALRDPVLRGRPTPRPAVQVDGGEIHAHAWRTPREALAAQRAGEIELPPPTFVTLASLAAHTRAADALAALRGLEPLVFLPRVVRIPGGACSLYPADAGWDARDPDVVGPRHRLLMVGHQLGISARRLSARSSAKPWACTTPTSSSAR
jgi:hypothetical protein